jgi:soluble lytic murein transglycosylase-like protein
MVITDMYIKKLILSGLLISIYGYTFATNLPEGNYSNCFVMAGLHYNIPPNLLYVIAKVESKLNPYAFNTNYNGSYDIGIMQINSSWLPKLARVGIQHKDLIDGCKNIQVGAWILSQNIKQYGLTPEAIGRYNSANNYYKSQYIYKIFKEYNRQKNQNTLLSTKKRPA